MRDFIPRSMTATRTQLLIYVCLYLLAGLTMNSIGKLLHVAEFSSWWQVLSCYVLYLLPASLMVRRLSLLQQYLHGLLALAPLEILGYALGTSHAFDHNLVDRVLGERNFTLAMVVFFAWILPVGNLAAAWIERTFVEPTQARASTVESGETVVRRVRSTLVRRTSSY